MAEYKLSYTAEQIDEKLGKIDELVEDVVSIKAFDVQTLATKDHVEQATKNFVTKDYVEQTTQTLATRDYVEQLIIGAIGGSY